MYSSDTDCCILYSYGSCSPRTGTLLARKMSTGSEWSAGSPVPSKQQQACFSWELPTAFSVDLERNAGSLAPSTRASQTATAVRVVSKPCRFLFSLQTSFTQFSARLQHHQTLAQGELRGPSEFEPWLSTLHPPYDRFLRHASITCSGRFLLSGRLFWTVTPVSSFESFICVLLLC